MSESEETNSLVKQTVNLFKKATILRLVIALLVAKLNPMKVLRNLKGHLRFGLAVSLLSFI